MIMELVDIKETYYGSILLPLCVLSFSPIYHPQRLPLPGEPHYLGHTTSLKLSSPDIAGKWVFFLSCTVGLTYFPDPDYTIKEVLLCLYL